MRLSISASLVAAALVFATPALAQTAQTGPDSSTTHGTSAVSTSRANATNAASKSDRVEQFKMEAEAKSACGSQRVVWANTSSHVLHTAELKYYGKTKRSAYMCEDKATQSGYHMAKTGQ